MMLRIFPTTIDIVTYGTVVGKLKLFATFNVEPQRRRRVITFVRVKTQWYRHKEDFVKSLLVFNLNDSIRVIL